MLYALTPLQLHVRESDAFGRGHFGATRGSRTHNGIDYVCKAGKYVLTPATGKVTKLGYPYADDFSYRYVEVTSIDGLRHRLFYCLPTVSVGDDVTRGDPVGTAQNIAKRYDTVDKKMVNHVHYEVMRSDGSYVDPDKAECRVPEKELRPKE